MPTTDLHVDTDTGCNHLPGMKEANEFKSWLSQLSRDFSDLDDKQRNETLDLLIATSGASVVRTEVLDRALGGLLNRELWSCAAGEDGASDRGVEYGAKRKEKGQRTQVFVGHVGAVFSVDYSDELQLLASGSADGTVNLWGLNTAECYNVFRGHTEWVTRVILSKCQVDSVLHRAGEYVLISMDRNEIKIWPISTEVNCKPLRTLAVSEDKSISLLPRLQFDGRAIVCASDIGIHLWDFATFELRIIPTKQCSPALLGFGMVFSLIYHWQHLYVMDVRTQRYICQYPLPVIRKSKRGSSIIAGDCDWLDGFDLNEKLGLVFATSMPDHSIFLIRWRRNDT
uniref:Uncharacterized protein n=1 Tax=Branchiostoma floridae TaxID=7739 RepID=C3Z3M6_BRAFL|eukprot:XP_002596778.1 hypothetical protein BRAFLDRAFT_73706 [Branchiostoma floridae]